MESIYLLIPIALILTIVAVSIFLWAVNNGQYEDLDREGQQILFDNEKDFNSKEKKPTQDD